MTAYRPNALYVAKANEPLPGSEAVVNQVLMALQCHNAVATHMMAYNFDHFGLDAMVKISKSYMLSKLRSNELAPTILGNLQVITNGYVPVEELMKRRWPGFNKNGINDMYNPNDW